MNQILESPSTNLRILKLHIVTAQKLLKCNENYALEKLHMLLDSKLFKITINSWIELIIMINCVNVTVSAEVPKNGGTEYFGTAWKLSS